MKINDIVGDLAKKTQEDIFRVLDRNSALLDDKEERETMLMLVAVAIVHAMADMEQAGIMPATSQRPAHVIPKTPMDYFLARSTDVVSLHVSLQRYRGNDVTTSFTVAELLRGQQQ